MAIEPNTRSPLLRFFDSFFQERNIKWVLVTGMLILFSSSLMLVTAHWQSYTPVWKHLILLGYTAGIYMSGAACSHRLGLRRTGTLLHALTVLLLPVTLLALHWVRGAESQPADRGINLVLLGLNLVFAQWAARGAFRYLLRGSQPTFVFSYLFFCVAGALAPGLPPHWAWAGSLLLWAVFTIGTVKVNRHVFWLAEENSFPRIFGFFPIALLGTQFLGLFAVNFAPRVPVEWLGLSCALVAVPVLLTADTVARVFQQRTGGLVRPLPWSIVLPIVVGLLLCAAGICLSAIRLPTGNPYALVPTAALVTGMLALVAHRTRKQAFVWAMLACLMLAYNFSPVFFREFARTVIQHGAEAVREPRLPLAFYGLTYLPLFLTLTVLATWLRRHDDFFAGPLRRFCIGVASFLLLVSLTHSKAIFPVAFAITGLFCLQRVWFAQGKLGYLALLGWIMAAQGLPLFAEQVLGWTPMSYTFAGFAWIGMLLWAVRRGEPTLRSLALVAGNWQFIWQVMLTAFPEVRMLSDLTAIDHSTVCLPLAGTAALSLILWRARPSLTHESAALAVVQRMLLRLAILVGLVQSLAQPTLSYTGTALAAISFLTMVFMELRSACYYQSSVRVWSAEVWALAMLQYFWFLEVITLDSGTSMYALLGSACILWMMGSVGRIAPTLAVFTRPFRLTAQVLPLAAVGIGIVRHLILPEPFWLGLNSLALLLAAGWYFWRGLETRQRGFILLAGGILNVALVLLWRELDWADPQFYMIPLGLSILALIELLQPELPPAWHDPLRYLGALVILVSPTFHIVGGSWLHLFTLMVASVAVVLLAIGIRVRALVYMGTGFLVADLVAMVVRGSIDNPNVLWISGLLLGSGVVALGAACENHREELLQRLRGLAATLKTWD